MAIHIPLSTRRIRGLTPVRSGVGVFVGNSVGWAQRSAARG
jgi:hypothetical protein